MDTLQTMYAFPVFKKFSTSGI